MCVFVCIYLNPSTRCLHISKCCFLARNSFMSIYLISCFVSIEENESVYMEFIFQDMQSVFLAVGYKNIPGFCFLKWCCCCVSLWCCLLLFVVYMNEFK